MSRDDISKTLFTVDTEKFFREIIPLSDTNVHEIYEALTEGNSPLYQPEHNGPGRWVNLPVTPQRGKEKLFYAPFTEIATKINDIVTKKRLAEIGAMEGEWVDCHHKSPQSTDARAASIRPDGAFISKNTDSKSVQQMNTELEALGAQIAQLEKQKDDDNSGASTQLEEKKKRKDKLCCLWWLQMANVVEIKCEGEMKDIEAALIQLCGYARQIHREQLDRRFVISFTLCFDKLNLYLFDRSGVVGTRTSINIHEQPKQFIQAIAAFSILPAEQLGWDPTMSMFCNEKNKHYSSYCFPWKQLKGFASPYAIQWVIESPKDGEKFISIRSLSLIGAELMCGRATVVLEVVKLKDFLDKIPQADVYVMKQSWQRLPGRQNDQTLQVFALDNSSLQSDSTLSNLPRDPSFDDIPFEDFVFKKAHLKDRIYCAGYVRTRVKAGNETKDEIVDTLQVIRKGITGVTGGFELNSTEQEEAKSGNKRSRQGVDLTTRESFAYELALPDGRFQTRLRDHHPHLASRRQTRVFMKMRGWPIKFFRNLQELVIVMRDAIEDHKRYFDEGILHRDPSGGNVLITIPDGPVARRKGFLIDLDHAKITKEFKIWKKEEQLSPTEFQDVKNFLPSQDSTINMAVTAVGADSVVVAEYINKMAKRQGIKATRERPLSPEQLGWINVVDIRPFFGGHIPGSGLRSGTFPYMSHQILLTRPIIHNGIHDLESFWWIVIHIVLTRAGPGKRRENRSPDLDRVILEYFEGTLKELTDSKSAIFAQRDAVARERLDELLSHVHPYFEPLQDLIIGWWLALKSGFEYEGFEYHNIHNTVLSLLDETIDNLEDTSDELTQQEDERRRSYQEATKAATTNQQCADTALPISPKLKPAQASITCATMVESESPSGSSRKRPKK